MHLKSRLLRSGFLMLLACLAGAMLLALAGGAQAAGAWNFLTDATLTANGVGVPLNPVFTSQDNTVNRSSAMIPYSATSVTIAVTVGVGNCDVTVTNVGVPQQKNLNANDTWYFTVSNLAVGANTIEIDASVNASPEDAPFTITVTRAAAPPSDPTISVTGFIVSPDAMSLDLKTKSVDHVVGIITPDDATNKNIYWSVSPDSIVKLSAGSSAAGTPIVVTALKNGTATITGTTWEGNHSDTCAVTVGNLSPLSAVVSPSTATAVSGDSVTFTATASGGTPPYAYQWAKSGNAIAGATESAFTIGNVISGDAGTYTCTVTDDAKATASASGTLNVVSSGSLTLTADPASDRCKLTATLKDPFGNPIPGYTVTISCNNKFEKKTTDQKGNVEWNTGSNSLTSSTIYSATATAGGFATATVSFTTSYESASECIGGVSDSGTRGGGDKGLNATALVVVVVALAATGLIRLPRTARRRG